MKEEEEFGLVHKTIIFNVAPEDWSDWKIVWGFKSERYQ